MPRLSLLQSPLLQSQLLQSLLASYAQAATAGGFGRTGLE